MPESPESQNVLAKLRLASPFLVAEEKRIKEREWCVGSAWGSYRKSCS